jgi:hypothetical protein
MNQKKYNKKYRNNTFKITHKEITISREVHMKLKELALKENTTMINLLIEKMNKYKK